MRKKLIMGFCITMTAVCLSACGDATDTQSDATTEIAVEDTQAPGETTETTEAPEETEEATQTQSGSKVLVAYFTRLPNTESGDDLDAVVQGGGPYGEIGDSYETADVDAVSSASITVVDGEAKGNVETMAQWIAQDTGGDLFSIETVEKYPLNYDALIEQGGIEQREDARPELSTHVENMDEYSVIFVGYPNWYYDMPMALYTFLEEYDLQGKTIVPFCTSAGSGFSGSIATIKELQPGATVIDNGLALSMYDVKNSETTVADWVSSLNIES